MGVGIFFSTGAKLASQELRSKDFPGSPGIRTLYFQG